MTKRRVMVALAGGWMVLAPVSGLSEDLVVHEWGTFTTLSGSDGVLLDGLWVEEERLPGFVHGHFALRNKGIGMEVGDVRVKMETPVLYFYAERKTPVTVRVDFPVGTISQWYPQRSDGEAFERLNGPISVCRSPGMDRMARGRAGARGGRKTVGEPECRDPHLDRPERNRGQPDAGRVRRDRALPFLPRTGTL
jgi:hypothetical protein